MPARTLARIEPTDDWPYLQLQFGWPEQEAYEAVRPIVLFGFTPAERAQQTGISASTLYRKAQRFEQLGIRGFLAPEEIPASKRRLPPTIQRAIVQLKAEYPPFRPHELATICYCFRYSGLAHFDHREWPTRERVMPYPSLHEARRWGRRHAAEEGHGGAVRGDQTGV